MVAERLNDEIERSSNPTAERRRACCNLFAMIQIREELLNGKRVEVADSFKCRLLQDASPAQTTSELSKRMYTTDMLTYEHELQQLYVLWDNISGNMDIEKFEEKFVADRMESYYLSSGNEDLTWTIIDIGNEPVLFIQNPTWTRKNRCTPCPMSGNYPTCKMPRTVKFKGARWEIDEGFVSKGVTDRGEHWWDFQAYRLSKADQKLLGKGWQLARYLCGCK